MDRVWLDGDSLDCGYKDRRRSVVIGTLNGQPWHCDTCAKVLVPGEIITAITTWNGPEPKEWESAYGTLLSDQAAIAALILSDGLTINQAKKVT